MKKYEIGEHTADLELRAWGRNRKELFRHAAEGVLEYAAPERGRGPGIKRELRLTASSLEELLVDWLNEILFWLEKEAVRFRAFEIERLTDLEIEATLKGKRVDLSASQASSEIKAATYHDLFIRRLPRGWEAHIILDI